MKSLKPDWATKLTMHESAAIQDWQRLEAAKNELASFAGRDEAERVVADACAKAPTQYRMSNHEFVMEAIRAALHK